MRGDFQPKEQSLGAFLEAHRQDPIATALAVIHQLEKLKPIRPVPVPPFSDPTMLEAWRNGAPMHETKHAEFAKWRETVSHRTYQIGENERRLRSTVWAEIALRESHPDMAQLMAAFHSDMWRLDRVSDDQVEREKQIAERLRAVARRR